MDNILMENNQLKHVSAIASNAVDTDDHISDIGSATKRESVADIDVSTESNCYTSNINNKILQ